MKVLIAICLVGVLLSEWPKGYWPTLRSQSKCLWRDIRRSFAVRISIVFLVIFLFDSFLLTAIQSVEHPIGTRLIRLGGLIGRNVNFWFLLLGAYLLSKVFRMRKVSVVILGAMFSAALTGVACNVLKVLVLRSRPAADMGQMSFFNVGGYIEHKGLFLSFPSGDVALVAGAAGFIFYFVKDWYLRALVVAIPLLTCASRIQLNRHWPSDTVLSVCLGLLIGHYLWRSHQSRMTNYSQLPLFLRVHRPLLESEK